MYSLSEMKVNSMKNPIGIDDSIKFSWIINSQMHAVMQKSYRIFVSDTDNFSNIVWDSGDIESNKSVNISYGGQSLNPCTRYYWYTEVTIDKNVSLKSSVSWFETGLMSTDKTAWNNAKWIGSPKNTSNTADVFMYSIETEFSLDKNSTLGVAICAKDKDNYVLFKVDMENCRVKVYFFSDNAWNDDNKPHNIKTSVSLGNICGYPIDKAVFNEKNKIYKLELNVNKRHAELYINDRIILSDNILPENMPNKPRCENMMLIGFKQYNSRAVIHSMKVTNTADSSVYIDEHFNNKNGILSGLGKVENNSLIIENEFNLINAVPAVNVRKIFELNSQIKSARFYCAAKGFYSIYINAEKVNTSFYNPGFTDYRKRIQYQTYDITSFLKNDVNTVVAVVTNGYYSGYVGYSSHPMIYGRKNLFIGKLVIEYTDGRKDIIITDESWQYTDRGAVINADFLQGEYYDARMEFDRNNTDDGIWTSCQAAEWDNKVIPTNGILENEKFELSAQKGPQAVIERELKPLCTPHEQPNGHIVYDFGQNMVGTVRIKLKGKRGQTIKIRYGEMTCKNGELYVINLRNAYNTDVYVLKGDENGEEFIPCFSGHGFRYAEITACGDNIPPEELKSMIIDITGLVITNITELTGYFECSNEKINRLQKNIEWGERGNFLLVPTDCPQRNERMGWTGDIQVFAATGAFNMNIRAFIDKWLLDLRDAQRLYNKNGAVPDTAPLGGDNRPDGCAGWGDAAVIVPWEMYLAYGDKDILEENYEMMSAWIEYQSRSDRQNFGVRIVDGTETPEKSDLASIPFIQCQQRRGDHLCFDESTPFILSATAYAAYVADIMSKSADILGKTKDSKKYRERFENIKRAFNEAWVKDDGSIGYWGEPSRRSILSKNNANTTGDDIQNTYYSEENSQHKPSQTAYALAIDFGLIPENKLNHTAEYFKKSIERADNKLTVGFLGISHLAPALTKAGYTNLAYTLLEQEKNPSWLYSVINGATTIWERWDSYIAETNTFGNAAMNSFNHYAYGAIGEWMYKTVLGINTDTSPNGAGYKKIILKPVVGGNLEYAKGSHNSPYGIIKSEWRKLSDGKYEYKCTIPSNTTALLHLPHTSKQVDIENKTEIAQKNHAETVYKLLSGEYTFVF